MSWICPALWCWDNSIYVCRQIRKYVSGTDLSKHCISFIHAMDTVWKDMLTWWILHVATDNKIEKLFQEHRSGKKLNNMHCVNFYFPSRSVKTHVLKLQCSAYIEQPVYYDVLFIRDETFLLIMANRVFWKHFTVCNYLRVASYHQDHVWCFLYEYI